MDLAGSGDGEDFLSNLQNVFLRSPSFVHVEENEPESAQVREQRSSASILDGTVYTKLNDSVYELYRPDAEVGKVEMEIVFFHGFRLRNYSSAHIDTWMSSSEPSECWIKTWLPQTFPRARVLTVSYDSSLIEGYTHGRFDLYNLAESLAQDIIVNAKVGQQFGTPVMLVGHCLGGLVIKELCLHVGHKDFRLDKEARENFVDNVMGVFFFATPHNGMKFKSVENPGPLANSLQILEKSTARLNSEFEELRRFYNWELHGVGESQPTRLKEFEGVFEEEVFQLIVEEGSSRPYLDEFMYIQGVDHFSICRPRDTKSSTFFKLCSFLNTMSTKAKVKNPPVSPQMLPKELVGLDKDLLALVEVLKRGDILEINICGMGGIGKTTLAKALYNEMSPSFEYTTFIESSSYNDTFTLETVIGSHLYRKGKKISAGKSPDLRLKTVLFVLDDIRDGLSYNDPLNIWYNECEKAEEDESRIDIRGSRLIVTSRERDVLRGRKSALTYDKTLLSQEESYELLVKHAFPYASVDTIPTALSAYQSPDVPVINLVMTVAQKCEGLPLTLEVIGKFLCGRESPEEWWHCLGRLDAASVSQDSIDVRLWKKLKVSYDGLNEPVKQMFLDAATIFNGSPLHLALAAWNTLSTVRFFNSKVSWNTLINKSLVYRSTAADDDKIITLHEQLRSLGRFISESEEENSRRRIWKSEDAWRVIIAGSVDDCDEQLRNIVGLRFHFSELPLDVRMKLLNMGPPDTQTPSLSANVNVVQISSSLFCKMTNLKYLLLDGVDIVSTSKKKTLPKSLIMLIWSSGAAYSEFPTLSSPGDTSQLTVLQLHCIHLKSLDSLSDSNLPHLKIIELRSARSLETVAKIDILKNLERLSFLSCPRLEQIPSSLGDLDRLEHLVFSDGSKLRSLPHLGKLSKLKSLILYKCSSLTHLPSSIGKLASLKVLDLHRCLNLEELPPSIGNLSSLETLNISGKFDKLPDSFGDRLFSLINLKFKYCQNLKSFPPNAFKSCANLQQLIVLHCSKLETLPGPDVFEGLKNLKKVIVGWVAVEPGNNLQSLMRTWKDHNVNFNVRGVISRRLSLVDSDLTNDAIDTTTIDGDHYVEEPEYGGALVTTMNRDESSWSEPSQSTSLNNASWWQIPINLIRSWQSKLNIPRVVPKQFNSRVAIRRLMKGENLYHRYLALESVHKSLQRIVVTVESHDQGYSSFSWAQGTELCTHSFGELSVRNPEGVELARIVIFRNLHAITEWQKHHCIVDEEEFLDLVKPGHIVEVWMRSEYQAWETYVRNCSLEFVPAYESDNRAPPSDDPLELENDDRTDSSGFQRSVIASYSCRNIPRALKLKKEYVKIVCRWQKLERIYVEFDSNVRVPEGDENCYNHQWGPIVDIGAESWSGSPFWGEISVIGKDGEKEEKKIRFSTSMYTGFGRHRHTHLVEDESFLNIVQEGCTLVLSIRHFTSTFPTCSCWVVHFQIGHAEIHLIPKLENIRGVHPEDFNAIFPNVGKLETSERIQRGRCLNRKYLSYQNPFASLQHIHVVVEAHECALDRILCRRFVAHVQKLLSEISSEGLRVLKDIAKARQSDINTGDMNKISPNWDSARKSTNLETKIPRRQASQSGENREAEDIYAHYMLNLIQVLGSYLSWEELSLLLINAQNGKELNDHGQAQGSNVSVVCKDSTWGELSILTPEGDEVGERIVVFRNQDYSENMSWQTHYFTVSDQTFLSKIKEGYAVALWLRSGPGWPLDSRESRRPAVHCARHASIVLVPMV